MCNVIVTTLGIVYSSNNRWALLLCQVMVAWYRYRGKNCFGYIITVVGIKNCTGYITAITEA
jgi:Na+/H+ antiporter NhaD/arsenite permease-like protein